MGAGVIAFKIEDLQLSQFNQTLTISLDDKTFRYVAKLQSEALGRMRPDGGPVSSGPDFTQEQIEYLRRGGV